MKEIAFYKGADNKDVFEFAKSILAGFDEYRLISENDVEKCKSAGAVLFCKENAFRLAKDLRFHTVARLFHRNLFTDAYVKSAENGIKRGDAGREAYDLLRYPELEVEKTVRVAFEWAEKYNKSIVSVDCADVLETGKLWRFVTQDVAQDYLNVRIRYESLPDYLFQSRIESNSEDIILTNRLVGGMISQALRAKDDRSDETVCLFNDTTFAAYGREKPFMRREEIKESVVWALRESFNRPDQAEWLMNKQ